MAGSRFAIGVGAVNLVYIVLYRLRILDDEEKHQWFRKWADISKQLPKGLKIVVEGYGAFGTPYTGFTVYEGPIEKFEEFVEILERETVNYIEKTETIIGTKGFTLPISEFQKILDGRPID